MLFFVFFIFLFTFVSAISVSLTKDWNLVFIQTDEDLAVSSLKSSCTGALVYWIDHSVIPTGALAEEKDTLKSGKTYLVRVDNACSLQLNGNQLSSITPTLAEGWNLQGFVQDTAVSSLSAYGCKNPLAFWIDGSSGSGLLKSEATTLVANRGYMIRCDSITTASCVAYCISLGYKGASDTSCIEATSCNSPNIFKTGCSSCKDCTGLKGCCCTPLNAEVCSINNQAVTCPPLPADADGNGIPDDMEVPAGKKCPAILEDNC